MENLEKYLEVKEKMFPGNSSDYSSGLSFIQTVYYKKGDINRAITCGLKAKKLKETLGLQDPADYAYVLYNLCVNSFKSHPL